MVDGVASRRRYWLFWGLAPCLFFTFAGNVLWTYVLPGLPALALLAADLLRAPLARSAWLRRGGLACLALTPLLFALFLGSLLLGSRAEQKSTAALLASDAGWRERPLVFWPKRPYSAVFYSGGRAQRAEDSELAGWLRRDALLAIRSRSFGALPDEVRQRLRCRPPVGQYQLCQRGAAWLRLLRPVGAVAGTRADARVVAAGVRAAGIDGAQAGLAVEVQAVAVGHAGEVKISRLWLKCSITPSFPVAWRFCLAGSSRSNSSTSRMRIRSSMRTSTGSVQQVALHSPHRPSRYFTQVSRRSGSAAASGIFFIGGRGGKTGAQ